MKDEPSENGQSPAPPSGFVSGFLTVVERVGNALPHPAILFVIMSGLVILVSWLTDVAGIAVEHPASKEGAREIVRPVNLLSVNGLHEILTKMVTNFTGFAPLGTVVVAMLGIGVAERSGLIGTALRLLVLSAPKRLLTFVIVFTGVLSNTASEVGYVLLVPLGGIIFLAVGRHPLAGLAAAFAGVSGGYSANLLLGTVDPLLSGLSQESARIIDPNYVVDPSCNYYFMFASTFFIAAAGTWTTEKIVVPRLGQYKGDEKPEELKPLTREERKGLLYAGIVTVLFVLFLLAGTVPSNGFLLDPQTGSIFGSPFLRGIVALIFIGATAAGLAYGIGARTLKSDADIISGMSKTMQTLGEYFVLVFFAAQFVAYFRSTNLGLITAIEGADLLKGSGLDGPPLLVAFVFLSAIINLAIGSASAKWAIMAPVFIPMFMLLGYSPELVQVSYRVGDSTTNIIAPMMSYFPLIVAFMGRYDKKAGIGTVISTMLPYTFAFLIVWSVLLIIWLVLGLPVGPGAPLSYEFTPAQ